MKKTKIGFLDSGIGGVTVLKECIKLVRDYEYVYYSDSFNNPYGDKSSEELIKIVEKVVLTLVVKGCNVIVMACNTACCMCANVLREKYPDIKIIAIEPAIKLVHDKENADNTLIMATKGTMDSEKFHELYDKYSGNNCYLLSCVGLANLIEEGKKEEISKYLEESLSFYKGKVTSIVLGCTHYPLIKDEIREVLGNVNFYDGANGVARQLMRILTDNNYESCGEFGIEFIDSSRDEWKRVRFFEILEGDYE